MRISVKGRYSLAAMTVLAQTHQSGEQVTVLNISKQLGISKIYLEQVFSLLKRGQLVTSVKGSQGGYLLTRLPQEITIFEILASVEQSLFEKTETTIAEKAEPLELAMQTAVFEPLDEAVKSSLSRLTLRDLVAEAEKNQLSQSYMYFL
jgi:Rrf2 family protein